MRKVLYAFIALIIIVKISYSIPILVNIKESLEGYFPVFEYDVENNSVVYITTVWENVGSLTCDSYLRLKVYSSEGVREFWSEKQNVAPGGSGNYEVYFILDNESSNNITIIPYFYYCNEIDVLNNITLKDYGEREIKLNITDMPTLNISYQIKSKDVAEINITTPKSGMLYIIPNNPTGWILPTKKIQLNKGINTITYTFYKPERTSCCEDVNFLFVYDGGMEYFTYKFNFSEPPKIEEKETNWLLIVSVLLNALFVLGIVLYFIRVKIFKK